MSDAILFEECLKFLASKVVPLSLLVLVDQSCKSTPHHIDGCCCVHLTLTTLNGHQIETFYPQKVLLIILMVAADVAVLFI